jgi:ATP-dependent helicase/nuclease subunit A
MATWTNDQAKAINNHGHNIIVSAGAGSGKTTVLSERVITTIKRGINIDDLLILTFTNAAAKEMKNRIRNNLKKYPELKEQYERIDVSYITTFDAYALSLVKKYNHLLNISDNISIIDQSILTLKKEEILTNILDEYYNNHNSKFAKLINDFCLKDDHEIFNAILFFNNKLDNKYDKVNYLKSYLNNNYNLEYIKNLTEDYVNIIKIKIESLKNKIDNIENYVDNKFELKLFDYFNNLFNSLTYDDIRSSAFNCVRLPSLPKNSSDEAKAIKDAIKNNLNDIKMMCKYNSLEEMEDGILATKDYVDIIIEIILKLDSQIRKFKKDNNTYDFIDIANMAIDILKENEDIRLSLKNKYYEILIDEYQDTNDIQDIFISLIANDNVYMVGDIKQSIYRFRNANPNLFKEKYDAYSLGNAGEKIDLKDNFRSRSEVISTINLMFNLIMDNKIGGANYFYEHQMNYGNKTYDNLIEENYETSILNYEIPEEKKYKSREIEIFAIAKDIKEKINNNYKIMDSETKKARIVNYSDFVILLDRSTNFNLYKKILEYLNIPVTLMRDQTISDSMDISIIKNIYNIIIAIYNNNFDTLFSYSYMSVARSFLFQMDDNSIFKIIKDRSYASTKIYEICYEIAGNLDELNNQELYELIIDKFDFYNKLITIGDIKDHLITLDSIGKIVSSTNSMGFTPIDFRNYLNEVSDKALDINLSLNKEVSNSVKIMTIHASKGLEFPICYFSGLDEKFNMQDLNDKFNYSSTYGLILPYLDSSCHSLNNTILKKLLENKYMEEEISEKIRLFYVALTRAKEKMIFVTHLDDNLTSFKVNGLIDTDTRLNYKSFGDILNSLIPYLRNNINNINLADLNLSKEYNLSKYTDYHDSLKKGNKISVMEKNISTELLVKEHFSKTTHKLYTKEEKDNMNLGIAMHYLFEITDFSNPEFYNVDDYKKNLVLKFINSGILNNVKKIYKEYEFMTSQNNELFHGIIDLLLIFEDYAVIVDYKLKNTQDIAYLNQLNGYKNYIESITKLPTKIYLYSIIDGKLIEK